MVLTCLRVGDPRSSFGTPRPQPSATWNGIELDACVLLCHDQESTSTYILRLFPICPVLGPSTFSFRLATHDLRYNLGSDGISVKESLATLQDQAMEPFSQVGCRVGHSKCNPWYIPVHVLVSSRIFTPASLGALATLEPVLFSLRATATGHFAGSKKRTWLTRRFRKRIEPSCSG